ncbi:hypothetical protein [Kitasatospora camelliae]|uniref:Uncharacterized protein n=1 Tax=Kitasatospora camelliae TaxID=3156397 RepID=A0AAU8JPU9_9ACTN
MRVDEEFGGSGAQSLEADFTRALREAADLTPDQALYTLAADAARVGRRRRNRQRVLVACGLLLAVAAGSAASFGIPGQPVVPAVQPAHPMTADESLALVSGLLPPGTVHGQYIAEPGVAGQDGNRYRTDGTLDFDDGQGASWISYFVEYTSQTPDESAVCMDGFQSPQESCERTVAPDGSVVVIDKLGDRHQADHKEWRATWAAPDGRRIMIIEHNGQPSRPNRPNPPLDAEQLRTLVTAPAWGRLFDALPTPRTTPTPKADPTGAAPAELLATLVPLLPPGAQNSKPQAGDGAHLMVTFEGRTSMLSVTTAPAGERGLSDKQYADSPGSAGPLAQREHLADGTLVVTNQHGNGKSATDTILYWTAAVYYPDGRSVSISEANGENGYTARPGTPALSLEQLRAIVMSPTWRS